MRQRAARSCSQLEAVLCAHAGALPLQPGEAVVVNKPTFQRQLAALSSKTACYRSLVTLNAIISDAIRQDWLIAT